MTRQQVLDLYFLDARHQLIEIAAFLDRVERASGPGDFRLARFRATLLQVARAKQSRARNVLRSFSDPTLAPLAQARGKGALGAWPPGPSAKARPRRRPAPAAAQPPRP